MEILNPAILGFLRDRAMSEGEEEEVEVHGCGLPLSPTLYRHHSQPPSLNTDKGNQWSQSITARPCLVQEVEGVAVVGSPEHTKVPMS